MNMDSQARAEIMANRFFPMGSDKNTMAHRYGNPAFSGLEAMRDAVNELDTVTSGEVRIAGRPDPEPGVQAIISDKTGMAYAYPTEEYRIIQTADMMDPIFKAITELGETPYGYFAEDLKGRVFGQVYFDNPDLDKVSFTEQLRDIFDSVANRNTHSEQAFKSVKDLEPFNFGFDFRNSYDKSLGFGFSAGATRLWCLNGATGWAEMAGSKSHIKHLKGLASIETAFTKSYDKLLKMVPKIGDRIALAVQVPLIHVDAECLLFGAGVAPTHVLEIVGRLEALAPESKLLGLNAWTLYNATTAYYCHREDSGEMLQTTNYLLDQTAQLLYENNHARLISKGAEMRQSYLDQVTARALAKTEADSKKAIIMAQRA
jgi:hypothetical protein